MYKVVALLLVLSLAAPAWADPDPFSTPIPPGSTCELNTNPPIHLKVGNTIYPCSDDDILRANICERKVAKLEKKILETPPPAYDWTHTAKIAAIGAGIALFVGAVGGVYLGSKL